MTNDEGSEELEAVSPIDGRYRYLIGRASSVFSEKSLMRYRCRVELEYLIAIVEQALPDRAQGLPPDWKDSLRSVYELFDTNDAKSVKRLEQETRHDVKALELYLRERLAGVRLANLSPLIHLCLTSEDVSNLAHSLMIDDFIRSSYIPAVAELLSGLVGLASANADAVMLGRTHGQPATPTTLGRELAVYCYRIAKITERVLALRLPGKLGGAVGNMAAHKEALPHVDWLGFSTRFVEGLGLEAWPASTQVIPHERISELLYLLSTSCSLMSNLCRDLWMLSALGYLYIVPKGVGSSTMPYKSNPIELELAEGNSDFATILLTGMATRLISSRLQRDLSDSTIKRNYGVALSHVLVAVRSLTKALDRIKADSAAMERDLSEHPEVVSEAYQVILRLRGDPKAYETLMESVRGRKISAQEMEKLAETLAPDSETSHLLRAVVPSSYTGYSREQTEIFIEYTKRLVERLDLSAGPNK